MSFEVQQWLQLFARWFHVFAGTLWIGQTALFSWLDTRMRIEKDDQGREQVWMVHSGGFYLVEKQSSPPGRAGTQPRTLHWFRWEAAATWLSGILMLFLVYYLGGSMLEADSTLSSRAAILIGVGTLVFGTAIYDILWQSPIARRPFAGYLLCLGLFVLVAFGLSQILSGRAAYIHMGALLGTIMAANVWQRILPAQKKMVAALEQGKDLDPALARSAKERSRHNTFLAIPVVFIMISNHYPTASYGHTWNWLLLVGFLFLGFGARSLIDRWNRRG